jgi:hypothetical protein
MPKVGIPIGPSRSDAWVRNVCPSTRSLLRYWRDWLEQFQEFDNVCAGALALASRDPTPLVRVEGYAKWMDIPEFLSKWMVIPSA